MISLIKIKSIFNKTVGDFRVFRENKKEISLHEINCVCLLVDSKIYFNFGVISVN